jgi:photosystem II stability/assembly factor-like uncharacterized protein
VWRLAALAVLLTVAADAQDAPLQAFLNKLSFRGIGPAVMGGRITQFAVNPRDKRIFYIATASSGIFKTTDAGTTFEPVFDRERVAAIGAMALAPSDPEQIWVGTGEANLRGSNIHGRGVFKSLNGGSTWIFVGLADSFHIGRIAIDPGDPNVVYVAAIGHIWGTNEERGLFKTTDGGVSWRRILYGDNLTGVFDVAIDPQDPRTLFATASSVVGFRMHRDAAEDQGPQVFSQQKQAGPANQIAPKQGGVYRSRDAGATWTRLSNGLPSTPAGRIGIDIAPKNPRIVVALLSGKTVGGVYRSEDGGDSWTRTSSSPSGTVYINEIRLDPNNTQRIWISGADPLFYSEDGGKTFCSSEDGNGPSYCSHWLERMHFDDHAIWIDPYDSDRMMTGTDGGIYISHNRGRTWEYNNTLPLGQFYQIGFDWQDPYWVYGGKQDTGTWGGPSRTTHTAGIANEDWQGFLVGDGYYTAADPSDPNILYAEYQGGRLFRVDKRTGERRDIRPVPPPGQPDYRVSGENPPFLVSSHDPKVVYFGGNRFFASHDRGETWTASADLTKGAGVIASIAESPLNPRVLWMATSDGNLQVSKDGGATWMEVSANVPNAPKGSLKPRVIASRAAEGYAYVAWDAYEEDDSTPYLFTTTDFGRSWKRLGHGLPSDDPIQVIREHPRNTSLLFAGTLFGLYVSIDRGENWLPLQEGLPPSPVYDLAVHPRENDLIVGTHGRGIYILDDLGSLEQLTAATLQSPLQLFQPRTATMYRMFNDKTNMGVGNRYFQARNPPYGASIAIYAAGNLVANASAKLTVLAPDGSLVREWTVPVEQGLNLTRWDLRYGTPFIAPPGLHEDPPGQPGGPRMRALALSQGPLVMPGTYHLRIDLDGHEAETSFAVKEDPRIQASQSELAQHRLAWHRLATMWAQGNAALQAINKLRSQLKDGGTSTARIRLDQIAHELVSTYHYDQIYVGFIDPGTGLGGALVNRIGQMLLSVSMYTAPPTPSQQALIESWDERLKQITAEVSRLEREIAAA